MSARNCVEYQELELQATVSPNWILWTELLPRQSSQPCDYVSLRETILRHPEAKEGKAHMEEKAQCFPVCHKQKQAQCAENSDFQAN